MSDINAGNVKSNMYGRNSMNCKNRKNYVNGENSKDK